jgi:hypothetical protein
MDLAPRIAWALRRRLGLPHPSPIFLIGAPKSGTTAIARLLASATGLPVSDDMLHRLPDPTERDRLYSGSLHMDAFVREHAAEFAAPLIKEPHFTFFVPALRACSPRARFVFIVRDPREQVRSVLNRLGLPGDAPAVTPEQLAAFDAPRLRGWRMQLEGRLPPVPGDDHVQRLAHRWNLAADACLGGPAPMIVVRYEDFVRDKAVAIEDLARQLGLAPRHSIAAVVDKPFQPRGDRCTALERFFGQARLQAITTICRDRMVHFGYSP